MLGAVKFQRIIPGDKDVDIGMLREDYEKFLTLSHELPEDLQLLEARKTASYNWLFAKIFQKGTRLVPPENALFSVETGIFVDIVPYDFVEAEHQNAVYVYAKLKKWILLSKTSTTKGKFPYRLMAILGKPWNREKIIDGFSRVKDCTDRVQNLVGGSRTDWFQLSEIQNMTSMKFSGITVFVPESQRYLEENYPGWQEKDLCRNELDGYMVEFEPHCDLEKLHVLQLELAIELKRICEKYDIPYFLVDGTALAALNIGKFLPWDDDLDIGMYWPDYLRFLRACKEDLDPRYLMKDFQTDSHFGCSFGQLISKEYTLIQENNFASGDVKGVFIDVHPFSNCSSFKLFRLVDYYCFKLFKLCLLERRNYMDKNTKIAKLIGFMNRFLSEDNVKRWLLQLRTRKPQKYAAKIHGRHPEDLICIENLKHLSTVSFEGINFPVQPDAERMLDKIYGRFDIGRNEVNRHKIISVERTHANERD